MPPRGRLLHRDDLFRPRQRECLGCRNVQRPGREHERRRHLRVPVRRDGPGRQPTRPAPPTRTAGTTTRSPSRFAGDRRHFGARSCVRPQTYSGPDAKRLAPGLLPRHAGNTGVGPRAEATTRRAPRTACPRAYADSNGWYNQPLRVTSKERTPFGSRLLYRPSGVLRPRFRGCLPHGLMSSTAPGTRARSRVLARATTQLPRTVTANPPARFRTNGWYNHPLTVGFTGD